MSLGVSTSGLVSNGMGYRLRWATIFLTLCQVLSANSFTVQCVYGYRQCEKPQMECTA